MQTLLSDGVSQGHLLLSVSLSELSRKAPTGFYLDQPNQYSTNAHLITDIEEAVQFLHVYAFLFSIS